MTEWNYYSRRRNIKLSRFCQQFLCEDYGEYVLRCHEKRLVPLSESDFNETILREKEAAKALEQPIDTEPVDSTPVSVAKETKPRRKTRKKATPKTDSKDEK